MAFASTISTTIRALPFCKLSVSCGKFTNGAGSTGGDVSTGLSTTFFFMAQHTGAAAVAAAPAVNETLPVNTAVTIVTTADKNGDWLAIGYR